MNEEPYVMVNKHFKGDKHKEEKDIHPGAVKDKGKANSGGQLELSESISIKVIKNRDAN